MRFPFKIIESKISNRKQFDLVDGHQPTHALFYLKQGQFTMEIGTQKEKIQAGDCVILPDYIQFRRNVVDPILFVYVKFTSDSACPFSFELPCGKVQFQDETRFLSNIAAFERLIEQDDPVAVCYREHLLRDILFQIYSEQTTAGTPLQLRTPHDALVAEAIHYIRGHLFQKIRIEDLCRAVGTNASTLNFRFRRETSLSVGQFLTNERMKQARHLLTSSTYPLAEIALRCGYENVFYFSNAFKKAHGISPSAYRKQNQPL